LQTVSEKIDRLAELKIDRDDVPLEPRRWPWFVAAVAALVIAGGYVVNLFLQAPVEVEVQTVRVSEARSGGVSVLDASGYVVARRQATVSSKIAGKVQEVLIEEGMTVDRDQVVATLDDSTQRAQLALAEAQLSSAQASLAEIRAQLRQAELDLARTEELAVRKLASESELDAARANAETLQARLVSGQQNVGVARRGVDVATDQLNNTVIRAPFGGVVVTKNAQPGEMISPISAGGGFTRTGICTIVDMDSLEIEVDVNEAYIQRVRAGQSVNAVLDAYPDWQIPAEVIAIVPTADRQKATVRVRIGFRERDERVLRDMGVKVAFLGSESRDAEDAPPATIYVNSDALRSDGDGSFVWIVRDDAVQRRAVTTGPSSARGQQIVTGLSAGDRIVTSAAKDLVAGQAVRISN
jgi:RND family efflux transporter MFP subunit